MKYYIKGIIFFSLFLTTVYAAEMSSVDFVNSPENKRQDYINTILESDPQGMNSDKITNLMEGLYVIQSQFSSALQKKNDLEKNIQQLTKDLNTYKAQEDKSKLNYEMLRENFENFKNNRPFKLMGTLAADAQLIKMSHGSDDLRNLLQVQLNGFKSIYDQNSSFVLQRNTAIENTKKELQELSDKNQGFQLYNQISLVINQTEQYLLSK